MQEFDVIIIGSGAVGAFIARNLSKYDLRVALLDKENDVGNLTSSANSAIIHSGYDPLPGTKKAYFNVLGNQMFDQIADELDVAFSRTGSLTIALEDEQLETLKQLQKRSEDNGVEVKILSKEETLALEPNINPSVKGALFAPSCGIIDTFNLVCHAVENAVDNGVNLFLNHEVLSIKKENDLYYLTTNKGVLASKIVVNAGGTFAEKIARMVEDVDWKMIPRKGEYYVLDHYQVGLVNHTLFPLPTKKGKGVLVTMTTSGNYLVGPSSEEVDQLDDYQTDALTLENVRQQATELVPNIPFNETIRVFSGLRPTTTRHDFIIEYSKNDPHFIYASGIESPGLVSSPAIGEYVVEQLIRPLLSMKEKENYNPRVRPYIRMKNLSIEKQNNLIHLDEDYGHVACYCEKVSYGEIKDVLKRSVPPTSLKGIKRRIRAGFGKCQGGFCGPNILMFLAKYYHVSPLSINYDQEDSNILIKKAKGN